MVNMDSLIEDNTQPVKTYAMRKPETKVQKVGRVLLEVGNKGLNYGAKAGNQIVSAGEEAVLYPFKHRKIGMAIEEQANVRRQVEKQRQQQMLLNIRSEAQKKYEQKRYKSMVKDRIALLETQNQPRQPKDYSQFGLGGMQYNSNIGSGLPIMFKTGVGVSQMPIQNKIYGGNQVPIQNKIGMSGKGMGMMLSSTQKKKDIRQMIGF